MTMEINVRWLFLVSIASTGMSTELTDVAGDTGASKLHCGPSVTAGVGDTVTLQCYTEPQRNVSQERIEWMRGDHEVHLRRDGRDNFDNQMLEYKNRTSLSDYDLSKGNCSVTLSNVLKSDSGIYTCSVKIEGIKEKECFTNLTVRPHEEKTSSGDQDPAISPTKKPGGDTDTSQMSPGEIAGIIIAVIAVIALFAVLWLIFQCRAGQDGGRRQEGYELAPMPGNIPPDPHEGQDRGRTGEEGEQDSMPDPNEGQDGGRPGEEDEQDSMPVQGASGSSEEE